MSPAELQKLFGHNVRRRRQELRLTQTELSTRIDRMSPGYLSEIEHGKRAATVATVAKIATALEVTASYLVAGQPGNSSESRG